MKNMEIVIREAQTEKDFDRYYELRWEVLRRPWNQPKGSEKDKYEDKATHVIACLNNKIVGVGRVHFSSEKEAQIRYMAVKPKYQRKGVGGLILEELERVAKEKGADYIVLNARENATNFYKTHGYEVLEKAHTLFGSISHWKMRKKLRFPGKTC
jgi:ribosomal protein S18 acetylase RimI-like enzyme